ncbi:MAG TPA: Ig-like domain-containing protein, partial [Mycobacteriales bacterium]|nr:Ig-like domain-containing protein [Mycobacteriales bacterium]
EPTPTISKTFATPPAPAPTTSSIAVTCSPNQTNTAGDTCQDDPRSDKTAKFTATVTNGVPAQPVAGVRVTFTLAQAAGNGALPNESTDTESLSSGTTTDKCITDAAGQCSTTLTDTNPQNDESFTVTASVPLNGGGTASDSATKNFHTPTAGEARNVSVAPKTDTKVPGSADTFTATVKDRFGNPVPGTTIDWSETGPGAFRTAAISCNTDAAGQCSIEVASLTGEQGTETVTATIHGSDASSECASPAGYSNYNANGASANSGTTPNAGGQNNVAPGAPAGNCSDSGTVTWKPATTPPPTTNPRAREFPVLNCWSPRKHVVVCRVYTRPRVQGADVVLRIVQKNGTTRIVRQKLTGERGRATFTFHHLKSGVVKRYVAHVRHTATTRAADTNHDKVRVK